MSHSVEVILPTSKGSEKERTIVVLLSDKEKSAPVYYLKLAVQKATGLSPVQQRLKVVASVDEFKLPSCVQVFSRDRSANLPLQITVSELNEMHQLQVRVLAEPNDTTLDIKFLAAEQLRVDPRILRLFHTPSGSPSRVPLQDSRTLAEQGITSSCTIFMTYCFPSEIAGHGEVHRSVLELKRYIRKDLISIGHQFRYAVDTFGPKRLLGTRVYKKTGKVGGYKWQSYREVGDRVTRVASGLRQLGLKKGDRVGIMSVNRSEWFITDMACATQGFASVPLYDTLGPDVVKYITNDAQLRCVVASAKQLKEIQAVRGSCPSLEYIIVMDDNLSLEESQLVSPSEESKLYTHTFSRIEKIGSDHPFPDKLPESDDLLTLCYTSGTTGDPKGAMITHGNLVAAIAGLVDRLPKELEGPDEVMLSYLPAAHIYERMMEAATIARGHAIGFYQGDTTKLVDDVVELKPSIFPGVPRVWQRIFDRVKGQVDESNFLRRFMFNRAFDSRLLDLHRGDVSPSTWDSLVFSKVAEKFGGKLKLLVSGAAPLSNAVAEFLRICFMCNFGEGYGLTETCGALTTTSITDFTYGQVGTPVPSVEVKLVDVSNMDYLTTDQPCPRGEVWVRGPNVFVGYLNKPALSAEALEDGWFKTGDVGMWLPNGNLKIIDRAKNIFKLSQGEYIRPEYIEGVYKQNKFVANIFVHGDSSQSFLVGIVVPDFESLSVWATANGLGHIAKNHAELVKSQQVHKFILEQMALQAEAEKLRGFEVVKRIKLISEDFSVDNGILTPTFKLKRHEAKLRFHEAIANLYTQSKL